MKRVLLGLGSNIEDRQWYLQQAIDHLRKVKGLEIQELSAFYETEPFGVKEQNAFLNAAVCVKTTLSPQDLLHRCQAIEVEMGRERNLHWGPRTLDIDLLHYEDVEMNTPELTLPHPYLAWRRFVLVPLLEIWQESLPGGKTVQELLAVCEDRGSVELYCAPPGK